MTILLVIIIICVFSRFIIINTEWLSVVEIISRKIGLVHG